MKKAFSKWYNYAIALGLDGIVVAIGLIPYYVLNDSAKWPITYFPLTMLFSGVVLFGVGFIIQDIYRARCRHVLKNWNNPLPEEKVDMAWKIFAPFFIAGILSFLVGGILYYVIR